MTPNSGLTSGGRPVRFGVLGFGHHAEKRLVGAVARSRETELVGLWRRNAEAATRDAAAAGVRAFATAEALCAADDVDAVFITSPDALHLEDVVMAARAGKAILCEKPLAMNAGEAEAMVRAAAEAGVLLGVAQNMRWYRSLAWVREAIAAGKLGELQMARAVFTYEALETPRRWITDGALACGGPIGDVGVHCLDALRYVLGQEIATLHTVARGDARYGGLEARAQMQGVTDKGCLVSVAVSAMSPYRTQIEIVGSEGTAVAENGLAVDQPVTLELRRHGAVAESATVSNAESYELMLDSFARAMRGEEDFRASAADGVENMRLLDVAYLEARASMLEEGR